MNKKDIINEIEKRIVTNINLMDGHNILGHKETAQIHATIVNELIELLATINDITFATQNTNILDKYNLWRL